MDHLTSARWTVALAAAAALLWAGVAMAAERQRRSARPRRPGSKVSLKVGQPAPEIALAPLTFEKDANGEMVGRIGRQKIKLSAFRARAPVVIFSSSYT